MVGKPDDIVELTFHNKKISTLKTTIKFLLNKNIVPDAGNLGGDPGNTFTASTNNGTTPDDIAIPIKIGNTFSFGCQSPKGIKVDIDYGTGAADWLSFTGAETVTKSLTPNNLIFSLVDGKLSGATKATVTLKNEVAGKDYVFTVTPSVTLSVKCPGGSKLVDLPAWITADKEQSTSTTASSNMDMLIPITESDRLSAKCSSL